MKHSILRKRLHMLIFVCLVPLTILTIYLLSLISHFSERYDFIVKKITMANAHNIDFKEGDIIECFVMEQIES